MNAINPVPAFAIYLLAAMSTLAGDASAQSATKDAHAAEGAALSAVAERLAAAYPDFVKGRDGDALILKDGTRIKIDDGEAAKSHAAWLARPDLKDMFLYDYPVGAKADAPALNFDPGRARNEAFFKRMYGDCAKGGVKPDLVTVAWMPKWGGTPLKVTRVNSVARRLEAVVSDLEMLPARFKKYLVPSGGTYVCRAIAGTDQRSAHGYGIAIDIAVPRSSYWRWAKGGPNGPVRYRNEIPLEIVTIFEKHGFIWGGRWYHYDTMHFEYRPELLPAANP